jgi:hypothetical protein
MLKIEILFFNNYLMCYKNKKFILLKECLLKYWDISGNILLYHTLNNERNYTNNYPIWVYIVAFCAIITSFARLMLKFRRLNIPSISCIMTPMLPCEHYMCDTRENGTYRPSISRLLCGGFILFFFWLWYAIFIYPFITFFVIICIFYYHIRDNEFNELLILYKNHNIIALFIEDIPILIILIQIYSIDKDGLFTLIWISILTVIKLVSLLYRLITENRLLYEITEFQNYTLTNLNSNSSTPTQSPLRSQNHLALSIDNQIIEKIDLSEN